MWASLLDADHRKDAVTRRTCDGLWQMLEAAPPSPVLTHISLPHHLLLIAAMFPSCYSTPADGSNKKKSSLAKLLLGVFAVYLLHSLWLLHGFFSTKTCDQGRGEQCITSYLSAKPRIQVGKRDSLQTPSFMSDFVHGKADSKVLIQAVQWCCLSGKNCLFIYLLFYCLFDFKSKHILHWSATHASSQM